MSLDRYPALDAVATRPTALREVEAVGISVPPLGAASLLRKNHEALWPDFAGKDLSAHFGEVTFVNLATAAATIRQVIDVQMAKVQWDCQSMIVTLAVGFNDLTQAYAYSTSEGELMEHVRALCDAYEDLVEEIRETLPPRGVLVVTTVFDPSDGTGRVPDALEDGGRVPVRPLDLFNTHIRSVAATHTVRLADVHRHFMGHGVSADPAERWYYTNNMFEPSARGASEIRRVWLSALARNAESPVAEVVAARPSEEPVAAP